MSTDHPPVIHATVNGSSTSLPSMQQQLLGGWSELGALKSSARYHRGDIVDALEDALRGAIGALEFSRDYHRDLGNEEQAFCQDKLDAANAALAKLENAA